MKTFEISSSELVRSYQFSDAGKLQRSVLKNLVTGQEVVDASGLDFGVSYQYPGLFAKTQQFTAKDCTLTKCEDGEQRLCYTYEDDKGAKWEIGVQFSTGNDRYIKKQLTLRCSKSEVYLEYITLDGMDASGVKNWTCPIPEKRIYVPTYIATLGQPVYLGNFFLGGESPVADNRIKENRAVVHYHLGRTFAQAAERGVYTAVSTVAGASRGDDMKQWRDSFLQYLDTFKRPETFRIQFNSWYDNMLDITPENIRSAFVSMHEGLEKYNVRPLDSYVVDDGWVDYHKNAFWAFNSKFPEEFKNELELTKEFGSGFGVWFGPRGGYSNAREYGKRMQKIGYHYCAQSGDICTGDPKYIHDLCDRMIGFMKKYNVNYFKIDGFAITPCKSKNHGHPAGDKIGLAFYTFLWEEWLKGFERMRGVREDVYLNITSYSHCSPWFLKWADAIWMNNCGDMSYCGEGDNLNQCLNYRDGRYYDLQQVVQAQFPSGHLYNHEPCYASRNYNPPLPARSHKTVVYNTHEFEKYLYWCMMRGTGFVELYYSPSMLDDEKWAANAKILKWAEENFSVLRHSEYIGGVPEKGEFSGYVAYDYERSKGFLALRNPTGKPMTVRFPLGKYCGGEDQTFTYVFGDREASAHAGTAMEQGELSIVLEPFEAVIFEMHRK